MSRRKSSGVVRMICPWGDVVRMIFPWSDVVRMIRPQRGGIGLAESSILWLGLFHKRVDQVVMFVRNDPSNRFGADRMNRPQCDGVVRMNHLQCGGVCLTGSSILFKCVWHVHRAVDLFIGTVHRVLVLFV